MARLPLLFLASSSPRRQDLMRQVGLTFKVLSPTADETPLPHESPSALVARLAQAKADSLAHEVARKHTHALIISADTIVVTPDGKRIFGKPTSAPDARHMLSKLAGHTHRVLTAYTILEVRRAKSAAPHQYSSRQWTRTVRSDVKIFPLTRHQIARYVASGEPMDKAGSYAAQGLGTALIQEIRGSYTNVVGLPMAELLGDIEEHFGISLFSWLKRR